MKNKEFWSNQQIEVRDPSKEACIVTIDREGNEISREYFGENARIEISKNI